IEQRVLPRREVEIRQPGRPVRRLSSNTQAAIRKRFGLILAKISAGRRNNTESRVRKEDRADRPVGGVGLVMGKAGAQGQLDPIGEGVGSLGIGRHIAELQCGNSSRNTASSSSPAAEEAQEINTVQLVRIVVRADQTIGRPRSGDPIWIAALVVETSLP